MKKIISIGMLVMTGMVLSGCTAETVESETGLVIENGNTIFPNVDSEVADVNLQMPGEGVPEFMMIDYIGAAETLEVTTEDLFAALGITLDDTGTQEQTEGEPPVALEELDISAAATILEVTEEALLGALAGGDVPSGPGPGQVSQQVPDFASAAETLGVTETALIDALGDPAQGEPDYAAVAEILGVSEDDLVAAIVK